MTCPITGHIWSRLKWPPGTWICSVCKGLYQSRNMPGNYAHATYEQEVTP